MTKTTGQARLKAIRAVKDLAVNDTRDIKGGKKTATRRSAKFEEYVRDNDVTAEEYANLP